MTQNKDLKRLVRARMKKTGEAYTAARAQITRNARKKAAPVALSKPVRISPSDYSTLAGINDIRIKGKTGCGWAAWVKSLDYHGAEKMSHRDIASLVNEKWKIDGWWAQTVAVGYERIKGLRAKGQRRDGTYEASRSRTFDVPVSTLFKAWADTRLRRRWLEEPGIRVRTANPPKTMRIGWVDGTIVAVGFTSKGKAKSSVAIQHTKLPDRETSERRKIYWSERLDALGKTLAESQPT